MKERYRLTHKILLNNKVLPQSAKVTQALFNILKLKVSPHFSPNLGSSDFHLYLTIHVAFNGKCFHNDDELQKAVLSYLQNLVAPTYYEGIENPYIDIINILILWAIT